MSFSSCFGEQGYAVFDDSTDPDTPTLTFYYGTPTGTYYSTDNTGTSNPGWYDNRTKIKKVVFDSSLDDDNARPTSCYNWFNGCTNLTVIDGIDNLNTSNVTNMKGMFSGCRGLKSLDVSHFNTEKVTDMSSMFYSCSGLKSLDVSHFNTENVTRMNDMFNRCSGLKILDLSNFNTEKVTTMNGMFYSCSSLKSLDVSHFNTANVTDMSYMFYDCRGLTSLTFGENFAASVTNMRSMFEECSSLTSLDLSNFNTANVKNMSTMFFWCSRLTSLDLSNFNTANVTDMSGMFSNCSGLTSLDVSNFNTANVTDMSCMFCVCSGLTSLDVSNFNTENVTNMGSMFSNCSGLTSLDVSNFNTANVTSMSSMFEECSSLTSLDLSNFNTANVTDMRYMFKLCSGLTSLTFGENFTTANVTDDGFSFMGSFIGYLYMFSGCSRLRYLDFYASNDKFDEDDTKSTKIFTEANLNRSESQENALFGSEDYNEYGEVFYGLPLTTVIYMPHGIKKSDYTNYTDLPNLVFKDVKTLKAANYYSEDKVEIELPREFKTAKAEYHRTMSSNYGSVVLPYAFKTDANIQAYTLDSEHTETMYFKDATTVAAHTPFAFKKLQSGSTANFVMTDEDFGITVKKTLTTELYTNSEKPDGWTTKGYYINETVTDYTGAFYIAGDKFYKASGPLTLYPHRVTFHKSGTSGEAQFYNINTVSDSETITAIEAADLRHTRSVAAEVYDVAGRRQPEMVKGLNIVRMNDGSVRKVSIR